MALPQGLPPHLLDALARGESALWQGEQILPGSLPTRTEALASGVEKDALLAHLETENADLRGNVDELKAEIEALKAQAPTGDNADLLESLIPDSESGLKALSKEKVEGIAAYKGIETQGKDKAALVAELLAQGA